MDWPNKTKIPPEGTEIINPDVGPELLYWPTPPFDITKDGVYPWIKWIDVNLTRGDNIRILTPKNPDLNIYEWDLNWSIGSYTNAFLWDRRLTREKETLDELAQQETLRKEKEEIGKPKKEDATAKTKWQDKGVFVTNRMMKDLKTDLEKSMKDITKDLEDKLTVTLKSEIINGNHKEAIIEKIQELMIPNQPAQTPNPTVRSMMQGPRPHMNPYGYPGMNPGMNPFYPGPFG